MRQRGGGQEGEFDDCSFVFFSSSLVSSLARWLLSLLTINFFNLDPLTFQKNRP